LAKELNARDLKLVQYLNEAYGKEKELETALQAHIAMTTKAPYKKRLQEHLKETKGHAREVARRIKQLGGKAEAGPISSGPEVIADAAGGKAPDYPQLSAEYVVDSDPDVIVLSDTKCCGQSPKTVRSRPGWGNLTAVQDGDVVPVDDDIASRWGPRIVDFVEVVAQAFEEAGT